MKLMTRIGGGRSLAVAIGLFLAAAHGIGAPAIYPLPLSNLSSITSSNSLWQNITNGSNYYRAYASNQSNDFRRFRGTFTPSSTSTKLALHSDDGSWIKINFQTVLDFYGENTHFQSSSALRLVPYTFVANQPYCVEIYYTNNLHTAGDLDGVTLYAYDGGGAAVDGIPLLGPDSVCKGGTGFFQTTCDFGSYTWSSSSPSVANGSSTTPFIDISGLSAGTTTLTVTDDATGKSGSKTIKVVQLGFTPTSGVVCVGFPVSFVITNAEVTNGVTWSPVQSTAGHPRTNTLTFTNGATNTIIASWSGCNQSATGKVTSVAVASLTASTNNLCGGGNVTYVATTTPPGFEYLLTWGGEFLGSGGTQTVTYTTPGIKSENVTCYSTSLGVDVTVHKVDITNTLEYALAGGPGASFGLSGDSVGPFTWSVTPSGPTVNGSGSSVTVSGGSTPGSYTVKAAATPLPSCSDTSTLQVVQVTFSANSVAFCEGTTSNLTFTVNPTNALSLLSFDTVTNTATGGTNTHAYVTVSGTNLTVHGTNAGTAYLRAKIGNTVLVGPTLQIVRVTFPTNDWYVGVGKSITNTVTIIPANASVTFDTVSNAIATAQAVSGGVKLTGVAPGTTQVRATVGGGMVCSTKNVTAVRVKFATNALTVCNGNSASVDAAVDPPGSQVTFIPSSTNLLEVTVVGTNVNVNARTNGAASVYAKVGGVTVDDLLVWSLTVRFPSNAWYVAPGGNQPFTVLVDPPKFAHLVGFMTTNTNTITVTAGAVPRSVIVHGVALGSGEIRATANGTNNLCSSKLVTVTTPSIASVQWYYMNGTPITDTNGNPGLGFRYFPDSPAPGASPSNQVRIRATVTPPVQFPNGVHFRVFDVDDPSTTNAVLDNESSAIDNKGTHTPPTTSPVSTDANGIAYVTMTLSMQPGDNFRAVAATDTAFFTGMAARQNDGANASVTNSAGNPVPGDQITPLLTIWRKLHVEVDSMRAVPSGANSVSGKITSVLGSLATGATQIVVNINLAASDASANLSTSTNDGRFENGDVLIGSNLPPSRTFRILGNGTSFFRSYPTQSFNIPFTLTKGATAATGQAWKIDNLSPDNTLIGVTISLTPNAFDGGTMVLAGQPFSVLQNTSNTVALTTSSNYLYFAAVDDDDNTLLPRSPNVTDLPRSLGAAYVQPVFDLANSTPLVPFVLHTVDAEVDSAGFRTAFRFDNVATEADPAFWTIYILGAFQDIPTLDRDPDTEGSSFGIVDTINGQGAAIFLETLRESPTNTFVSEAFTVSHEVGHLFNGVHPDGWLMAQSGSRTNVNFSPTTLNRIRSVNHP